MYLLNKKNKFFKNESSFTIVEFLMVVVIILILSTIILVNYSTSEKELALQRAVHKLAQDIRIVQEMAMSADDFGNPPTPSKGGYGIYFNINEPNHYILFADCDHDAEYDTEGITTITCFNADQYGGRPELVEDISLEKSVKIGGISSGLSLYITFVPPNPDANFYPDAQESIITLTAGDSHKSVKINKAGLIEIESLASSPIPTYTPTPTPTYTPTLTPTPTPTPICKSNGTDCLTNDECCSNACYIDNDGDSYAGTSGNRTCKASAALSGIDCDDNNSSIYPGTTCNGDCSVCNTSGNCDPKSAGENGLPACQRCDGSSFSHVNIATFFDSEGLNPCSGTCDGYCDSGSCIDTDTAAGTCFVSTNIRVSSGGDGSCSSGACSITRVGKFWVGNGGNWSDATNHWATSSGGAPGAGNLPTSTDNVYFDANSFSSGSQTVTVDAAANCADMNWTGVLNTPTFAGSVALNIYGSLTFVSEMTRTYTGAITFAATSTGKTLTFNGKTMASATTFNGVGGGWTLQDAWANGASAITLTAGTLNTNGQTVTTTGTFSISGSTARTLTLGASTINCGTWTATTVTNLTFNANTSVIKITSATTFNGGGRTYNEVQLNSTAHTVAGINTYTTLTRTGTASKTNTVTFSANQTITGNLTLAGNSATNRLLILSSVIGTVRTLTAATVSVSNADFQDITGAGGGNWNLSAITGLSGDAGGNSGITFTTSQNHYWVGNGGSWSSTAKWSTSSGGASGARIPLPQDDCFIDANSITSTGQTITADMPRLGKSTNFTGVLNTPTLTLSTATSIFGSLTLGTITLGTGTTLLTFEGRSSYTLTSNGLTFEKPITLNAPTGTLTLGGNLTLGVTRTLTITNGTLSVSGSNYVISTGLLTMGAGGTLTLGSATHLLTGTGTVFTGAGTLNANTSTLKITNTSITAITFAGGGKTYNNLWFSRGASTGNITISGSNTFADFKDDGSAAHSVLFTAGTTQTVTTFTVLGTAGNLITINSTTIATHALVKSGGGTISRDYLNIQHSVATPATTWYAGVNSVNNQAVATAGSGWIFTAPP